jgi:hypothetical protein
MHNVASLPSFITYVYFMSVLRQFNILLHDDIVTLGEVK